jgi:hypothetical protein
MIFDMLTADAASKHGHEFSDPQPARWLVPRRSPFRVFPYTAKNRLSSRPRVDRGAMSDLKEEPEESEGLGEQLKPQISISHLRIPGSFHDQPPSPPLNNPLDAPVSDSSPPSASAPAPSPIQSVTDEVHKSLPEKRCHRSKTRYAFAHPPPTGVQLRKQGIIRPNTLFQLHTQTASGFHKPDYEVLPLNLLGNNNFISNRFKRLGRGKLSLGTKDLAIIKATPYNISEGLTDGSSNPGSREVLGIISASTVTGDESRRSAQIVLDNAVWSISQKRKDVYDLSLLGDASRGARWYIPKSQRRSSTNPVDGSSEPRFYFAALLPDTKKHPTVASMIRSSLDVYDTYTTHSFYQPEDDAQSNQNHQLVDCSNSISSRPPSSSASTALSIETDEALRRLVIVSGVWVALCEGWSPHMIPDMEQLAASTSITPTPRRSVSSPQESLPTNPLTNEVKPPMFGINNKRPPVSHDCRPSKSAPVKVPTTTSAKLSPEPTIKEESEREGSPLQVGPGLAISTPVTVLPTIVPTVHDQTIPVGLEASPSPDPTAQFRHLMSINLTSHSPSPPPVSKLDALFRRRSTHGSTSESRDSSHARSANWARRLSLNGTKSRDSRPTSQTTSVASSEYDGPNHGYDGSNSQHSGITTTAQSLRSMTPPVTSPTHEPISYRADSILSDQGIEVHAGNKLGTPLEAISSAEEPRPGTAIHKKPDPGGITSAIVEESRPSSSEESSSSSIIGVGAPYWREFDRIQSRAFAKRAEQLQGDPNLNSALEASSSEATPSVQRSDGDVNEDMHNAKSRWLSGIRHSVRRRRRSMVD